MKDFIKKSAGTAADIGSSAVKGAITALVGEVVKEMMEESGVTNLAKDKLMEVGMKVVGEMGVDAKKIQRDLIKEAIRRELNLKS